MGGDRRKQEYFGDTIRALDLEAAAARVDRNAPVMLEEGRQIASDGLGAVYRFTLLYEAMLPEGMGAQIDIESRRWQAEILRRDGLHLSLLVQRNEAGVLPSPEIRLAFLEVDAAFLIEELRNAVEAVAEAPHRSTPASSLLDLLCGDDPAELSPPKRDAHPSLNSEQATALYACRARPVWFVWGPPGTGKTTTLGAVVAAARRAGASVLVTAHSNVAVDATLLATLSADKDGSIARDAVRAGPAMLSGVKASKCSSRERALDARPDLATRLDKVARALDQGSGGPLRETLEEWREVLAELRSVENEIIRASGLVFATLSKLVLSNILSNRSFNTAIVDEVSMSYPAQVIVAASHATSHLHVFGDCRQLPPIVKSEAELAKTHLGRDVFTACGADQPGAGGVTMLKEQFRMHPDIREVVSDFCYGGELRDGAGLGKTRGRISRQAPFPGDTVTWLDVSGLGARHFPGHDRHSRFNPISAIASVLLALESREHDVVILTPYRLQARLLSALVLDSGATHIDVGTVHRYQGSEAPIVILDLVDSRGRRVGMPLAHEGGKRLLNVGVSRARGKVVIVGSIVMPTEGLHPDSARMLRTIRQHVTHRPPRFWLGPRRENFRIRLDKVRGRIDVPDQSELIASWFSDKQAPADVEILRDSMAESWTRDHYGWVDTQEQLVIVSTGAGVPTVAAVHGARRFNSALSEAITGTALAKQTGRDRIAGKAPGKAARHDQCAKCGGRAVPLDADRYRIELVCDACGAERRASDREIKVWLREVGPSCPGCRSAMRLISGPRAPRGPFFGCTSYPECNATLQLEDLLWAAKNPDPPPVREAKVPTSRSKKTAARRSTTSSVSSKAERTCSACFLTKSAGLFAAGSDVCRDCA